MPSRNEARKLLAYEDISGDVRRPSGSMKPAKAARNRHQEGRPGTQGSGLADLQERRATGQGQHPPGDRPGSDPFQCSRFADGTDHQPLRSEDEITQAVGPSKLIKYWPPALKEWTTKAARDAFFSSPALPRLLKPDAIKKTIADGVNQKLIAYAGKTASGQYEPFIFEPSRSR